MTPGETVYVVLVHRKLLDDGSEQVYIAGTYSDLHQAGAAVNSLAEGVKYNVVGTFLDVQAGFYPGFRL